MPPANPNATFTVPFPIELPAARSRCPQVDITSPDGQCEFSVISDAVGYCYTHRLSHAADVHTLVIPGAEPSLAYTRCFDGYHGQWRGRIDTAGRRVPTGVSTAVPALPGHAQCALLRPVPGSPHRLHVDSPSYRREIERRKRRALRSREPLAARWAEYAAANGRAGRRMCIAWRYQYDPSQPDPDEVVTLDGRTLHEITGCCAAPAPAPAATALPGAPARRRRR